MLMFLKIGTKISKQISYQCLEDKRDDLLSREELEDLREENSDEMFFVDKRFCCPRYILGY